MNDVIPPSFPIREDKPLPRVNGEGDIIPKLLGELRDLENSLQEKLAVIQRISKETPELSGRINLSALASQEFGNVPEGLQPELLQLIMDFAEKAKTRPAIPVPTSIEEMRAAKIETYKEYIARTRVRDGKRCLEENWGKFLKSCSPHLDRDYISQATIRKLDRPLLKRLEGLYTAEEINEFLPSKPLLNKQIAQAMTQEQRSEIFRLSTMLQKVPLVP